MTVSYTKLWHILLDRKMKKRDLERLAGLNEYTIKKLSRDELVTVDVLWKISRALGCPMEDLVDFAEDEAEG